MKNEIKALIREIPRWVYWYPFRYFIQYLPRKTSYLCAKNIGLLSYFLQSKARYDIGKGLKLFLNSKTDREICKIVKNTFEEKAFSAIDTFYYPKLTKDNIGYESVGFKDTKVEAKAIYDRYGEIIVEFVPFETNSTSLEMRPVTIDSFTDEGVRIPGSVTDKLPDGRYLVISNGVGLYNSSIDHYELLQSISSGVMLIGYIDAFFHEEDQVIVVFAGSTLTIYDYPSLEKLLFFDDFYIGRWGYVLDVENRAIYYIDLKYQGTFYSNPASTDVFKISWLVS